MTRARAALLAAVVALAVAFSPPTTADQTTTAPRIVSKSFRFRVLSKPYRPYRLYVEARLRICDDSRGALRAVVSQEHRLLKHLDPEARTRFGKNLPAPHGCRRYRLLWRVTERFFGFGWYIVNVRVRDVDGLRSNPVGRAWFTRD